MKTKKKIIAIIMMALLCMSLAACGGGGQGEGGSASGSYTVGICQLVQHDALDAATQGFKDALTEELGDAVTFDEQNAQGDSAVCATIVNGFVSNNYDLIMANATPALQAAVSATTDIPILGTSVTDYGAALEMEFDPQGGTGINVSGSSDGVPGQLYADLVKELVPDAKNVSILYCSAEANSKVQSDDFEAAMKETMPDATCTVFTFSDSNDIQSVATSAIANCDALYIPTDNQAASNISIIKNVCEPAKIPVIAGEENMCANGGLATISINYYDIGHACGEQAVQVLRDGADITTMPIAYASDPVKEYNAEYAEAIGFTIPEGYKAIEK
ncbi:MAG: ABC transporter substrate-binding protein [Mogibacterium sp.]|nr:ABC transporter substrate-binding protein [Mogibacterium sp.]